MSDHFRIVHVDVLQQSKRELVRGGFLLLGKQVDWMIVFREKTAGGDKQAAGIALLLHILGQHVVTCQDFIPSRKGFIQQQLAALYDQISSRKPYAYDPEQDADYQRYARLYQRQGQAAMEDTMGQAAALSGGYGSSYAQQTGQQAYSQYLSELSALIPELEKQARSRYEQQGQALMDRYGLLQQAEQVDYSRWQDQLKAWQSDSDRAYEYYNSVGKEDRDLYSTMLKYYAGKAADEQKAADGVRYGSGRTVEGEKPQSLSSTASDSLERAMGNYLKAGDTRSAQNLITRYKERMTHTQTKRFSARLDKYGAAIGW